MVSRRGVIRLTFILPALAGSALQASSNLEARGVWLHPESMFDADEGKGKEQVRTAVGRLAAAGFNLVLPWIRSAYLVALEDERFREGHPTARWDVLGYLIHEAQRAGLQSEIWYAFTSYRTPGSPDFDPRVGGDPSWAARRITEYKPDPGTGKPVTLKMEDACPQHPRMRRWQQDLLVRAFKRYPLLRGLHVEEPGYNYAGYCLCDLCLKVFPKIYGVALPDFLDSLGAEDFRTLGTSAFMAEIRQSLRAQVPRRALSANGGVNWRADRKIGRDWGRWARSGWLDYYTPQIYVNSADQVRVRLTTVVRDLSPDCPVYAGLGLQWGTGKNTVEEIVRQIETARESGAAGIILFHLGAFTTGLYQALATGPFRTPASLPTIERA